MFNFFGSPTTEQFQILKEFSDIQKVDLDSRREWLDLQLVKIGKFTTTYTDTDMVPHPESFSATAGSYADKLLQAYTILGGVPERDMLLRDRDNPVFLTKGPPIQETSTSFVGGFSDIYSNGRRYRGGARFDRDMGLILTRIKKWQFEPIKRKREQLEFKIKRALDYSESLQDEMDLIDEVSGNGRNSLNALVNRVDSFISSNENWNIIEGDRFGLNVGRFADYAFDGETMMEQKQRGGV